MGAGRGGAGVGGDGAGGGLEREGGGKIDGLQLIAELGQPDLVGCAVGVEQRADAGGHLVVPIPLIGADGIDHRELGAVEMQQGRIWGKTPIGFPIVKRVKPVPMVAIGGVEQGLVIKRGTQGWIGQMGTEVIFERGGAGAHGGEVEQHDPGVEIIPTIRREFGGSGEEGGGELAHARAAEKHHVAIGVEGQRGVMIDMGNREA